MDFPIANLIILVSSFINLMTLASTFEKLVGRKDEKHFYYIRLPPTRSSHPDHKKGIIGYFDVWGDPF